MHNSLNHYLPDDQCMMIQNHIWVKDVFKVQDKLMNFNVVECEKLIDTVLDSTL